MENETITLDGNLVVSTTGRLTLTTGGGRTASSIEVAPGGSLSIHDSTITHLENGVGFQMNVRDGSHFVMKDSQLTGCGHEWWYGGVHFYGDDFLVENNAITDTMLTFFHASGGRVVSNTIAQSYQAVVLDTADTVFANNVFLGGSRSATCRGLEDLPRAQPAHSVDRQVARPGVNHPSSKGVKADAPDVRSAGTVALSPDVTTYPVAEPRASSVIDKTERLCYTKTEAVGCRRAAGSILLPTSLAVKHKSGSSEDTDLCIENDTLHRSFSCFVVNAVHDNCSELQDVAVVSVT